LQGAGGDGPSPQPWAQAPNTTERNHRTAGFPGVRPPEQIYRNGPRLSLSASRGRHAVDKHTAYLNPTRPAQPPHRGVSGGSAPGADMTSGPGPRFPRTGATQPLVEVLAAYLNPVEGIHELRAALGER